MFGKRARLIAAVALLLSVALPSYTCSGYVGPDGRTVTSIPSGTDSAQYRGTRIRHYPLQDVDVTDIWDVVGTFFVILTFVWPVPFLFYRRRRGPTPPHRGLISAEAVLAVASAYWIYVLASIGRLAIGTYIALAADAVLLASSLAELWMRFRQRGAGGRLTSG